MEGKKAGRELQRAHGVEDIEERQWRLKLEEAKAALAREEDEWSVLVARAKRALENEEREWQRLMARAQARSSGAFPVRAEAAEAYAGNARARKR